MTRDQGRCERLARFSLCFLAAWWLTASAIAQGFTPIRVNAGGGAFTDAASNVWSADTGYNTGSTASTGTAIAGTTDDSLYQTLRWDSSGPPVLEYTFTVPNGVYEVNLLFAEIWSGAFSVGARRFNVQLEGEDVLQNLDVYAEAGANTALLKTLTTGVTDGAINIRVMHGAADNPMVSAIEIKSSAKPSPPKNISASPVSTTQLNLSWSASIDDTSVTGYEIERCEGATCTTFALIAGPLGTSYQDSGLTAATTYRYRLRAIDLSGTRSDYSAIKTVTTTGSTPSQPVRINSGGGAYTDGASNLWSADTGYNSGSTASSGTAIAGTTDDSLYQTLRWDGAGGTELEYTVSVPTGQYEVRLHFAETWSGAYSVGARRFGVQLEGATAFTNLDVFAEAGANTALVKAATVGVADGNLNIRFVHTPAADPFVNAIEVLWFTPADGTAPDAPTGLSVTAISGAAVALSWSASTDNVAVAGYSIERCVGASCSNFAEVATNSGTSRNDDGLIGNTTYRYRVRAYDAAGNRSAYSAIAEATTPNASAEYVYDELGRLVLVTVASGASIVYAYDASGNVTAIVRAAP